MARNDDTQGLEDHFGVGQNSTMDDPNSVSYDYGDEDPGFGASHGYSNTVSSDYGDDDPGFAERHGYDFSPPSFNEHGDLGGPNIRAVTLTQDQINNTPFGTGYIKQGPTPTFGGILEDPMYNTLGKYMTGYTSIPGLMYSGVSGLASLAAKMGMPGERYFDSAGNEYSKVGSYKDWNDIHDDSDNEEELQARLREQQMRQGSLPTGGVPTAPVDPTSGGNFGQPVAFRPYTEKQLGEGMYGYFNPGRVTYPGNAPYPPTSGQTQYARGGLASFFKNTVLPAAVGFGATAAGLPVWAGAGLAGLGGYALGGKNRSLLDGIKGALAGYGGGSMANIAGVPGMVEAARGPGDMSGIDVGIPSTSSSVANMASQAGTNIADAWKSEGLKAFATPAAAIGASMFLPSGSDMAGSGGPTTADTAGGPTPTFRTEEERQEYLRKLRESRTAYTPFSDSQLGKDPDWYQNYKFPQYTAKQGGSVPTLEQGSFVIPADVVADAGDGNTEAGYAKLNTLFGGGGVEKHAIGGPVKGPTGGLDDLRQTTIEGQQAAAISDGEYVIPAGDVARIGDGSVRNGSEKLYNFLKQIRLAKHGTTEQPKTTITMNGLRAALGD